MKDQSHHPRIEPELEARIVALVLGEASDFERDELSRLIDQRPELAALKKQIQSVHGLLRDVATGESVAEDDDWKLPAEKRSAVLAVISGHAQQQPAKQVVNKFAEKRGSVKGNVFWNVAKIAAVFCVVGFFGSLMIPSFNAARESAHRISPLAERRAGMAASIDAPASMFEASPAPPMELFMMDGAGISTAEGEYIPAEPAAVAEFDFQKNSESALLAIRENLDSYAAVPSRYYLQDDVQYFPTVPEFQLPREAAAEKKNRGLAEGATWSEALAQPPADSLAFGVQGLGQARGEVSPPTTAMARTELEAGTRDAASKGVPVSGLGERSVREADSNSSRGFAAFGFGDPDSGQGQNSSPAQPQRQGSTRSRSLNDLEDSQAAGKAGEVDGFAAGGMSMDMDMDGGMGMGMGGGGGFAGAATVPADEGRKEISAEHKGERTARSVARDLFGTNDLKMPAPATPMVSGMAYGNGKVQPKPNDGEAPNVTSGFDGITSLPTPDLDIRFRSKSFGLAPPLDGLRKTEPTALAAGVESNADQSLRPEASAYGSPNKTEKEKAEDVSGQQVFNVAGLAESIPSPTNKPMAAGETAAWRGRFGDAVEFMDEVAKESVTTPSDDDIAISDSRVLDQDLFESRRVPEPVAGTAIAQPRADAKTGQATQNNGWAYRAQVKKSLGELSALNELPKDAFTDRYAKDAGQYWIAPQLKQKSEQVDSLRRRAQPGIAGENSQREFYPHLLGDNSESMDKAPARKTAAPAGLDEKTAQDEAFSTFSLHVSDVSFKLAQAALSRGEWPEAAKVRIEEFVNAFDYGDPMPSQSEKVACRLEQSIHPFLQQRNLLRVSMRTAAAGRSSNTPLRLTLLLDNSGSMERVDRQQTVRRAFALLAQQLKPIDQITLISFARQPRLLAEEVSGAQLSQLVGLIDELPSEGGTNIEAALQLAFEKAQEQHVDNAQNRIILLTDGAVNLGDANPESLSRMVTTMREEGIAFDAAGISAEGLNDEILEALTRKGDGRYYLLDSSEAVDDGFARQIAGALRPSAKNVKVQIEFNPKRVGRYKLLGFEKHRLKQEDFRNDKVDAAEMAAAEAGVAVYQFEARPDGEGDVGSVSVRFLDLSTGQMIENRWPIPYEADAPRVDQAAPSLRIAASAALLAAKLRGEPLGETVDLKTLSSLIAGLPDRDRNANRVGQLQRMIGQARQVSGK